MPDDAFAKHDSDQPSDFNSQLSAWQMSASPRYSVSGDRGAAAPRPPLPRLEIALLVCVLAQLLTLAWGIGGSILWVQIVAAVFGMCSFVLALMPRTGMEKLTAEKLKAEIRTAKSSFPKATEAPPQSNVSVPASSEQPSDGAASPSSRGPESSVLSPESGFSSQLSAFSFQFSARAPQRALLRFPIFWLGLALFALIAIQGLNPAWQYHEAGGKWWVQGLAYHGWLPHGIAVPFNWPSELVYAGEWRMLLIYVPIWMTVCSLWIGITRRRSLHILFTTLVVSGLGLSIVGIAQRATGTLLMYGWYRPSLQSFFGPFVYKNHGGAYLLLMIGVTCALGVWYHVRSVRRLDKSSPAGVFVFLAVCIAIAVFVSYARGATLGTICYLGIVVAGVLWYRLRLPKSGRNVAIALALLVPLAVFAKLGLTRLYANEEWARLHQALSGNDSSVEARRIADHASAAMLVDHWLLGTGSGSFVFLFGPYQQRYPAIADISLPHAHNDFLEFPIELGVPGVLLIAAGFVFWIRRAALTDAWRNPCSSCLLLVAGTLTAMSWGDFFFYNPAILATWCILWPAALRWAEVDRGGKAET